MSKDEEKMCDEEGPALALRNISADNGIITIVGLLFLVDLLHLSGLVEKASAYDQKEHEVIIEGLPLGCEPNHILFTARLVSFLPQILLQLLAGVALFRFTAKKPLFPYSESMFLPLLMGTALFLSGGVMGRSLLYQCQLSFENLAVSVSDRLIPFFSLVAAVFSSLTLALVFLSSEALFAGGRTFRYPLKGPIQLLLLTTFCFFYLGWMVGGSCAALYVVLYRWRTFMQDLSAALAPICISWLSILVIQFVLQRTVKELQAESVSPLVTSVFLVSLHRCNHHSTTSHESRLVFLLVSLVLLPFLCFEVGITPTPTEASPSSTITMMLVKSINMPSIMRMVGLQLFATLVCRNATAVDDIIRKHKEYYGVVTMLTLVAALSCGASESNYLIGDVSHLQPIPFMTLIIISWMIVFSISFTMKFSTRKTEVATKIAVIAGSVSFLGGPVNACASFSPWLPPLSPSVRTLLFATSHFLVSAWIVFMLYRTTPMHNPHRQDEEV